MDGITSENSDGYLVPELQDSEWELEYVEVAADEQPADMSYGWLVESYFFVHSDEEIGLTCNIEDHHQYDRKYQIYADEVGGGETIYNFQSRKNWWSGIRRIMRKILTR